MMDPAFQAFAEELEKRAISVGLLQRALAGRAAQGVGGAAALGRQVAGAAAGGATTARQALAQGGGLARARLGAVGEGGLAARRAQSAFAGPKANLQARFTAAEGAGMHSSVPLRTHEGYMGATHAYSPQYTAAVARPAGAIHDPKGIMARPATSVSATGATQIAPTVIADRTQVGQIGGKRLSAPGNPFGREAAEAAQLQHLKAPSTLMTSGAGMQDFAARPRAEGGTAVVKRRAIPAMAAAT